MDTVYVYINIDFKWRCRFSGNRLDFHFDICVKEYIILHGIGIKTNYFFFIQISLIHLKIKIVVLIASTKRRRGGRSYSGLNLYIIMEKTVEFNAYIFIEFF